MIGNLESVARFLKFRLDKVPALVTNVLLLQRASSSETIILCVLFVPVQTYLGVVSCHSKLPPLFSPRLLPLLSVTEGF